MAKKKRNKKSTASQQSKVNTAKKKSAYSRNRLLVSVIGVIAVTIIAYMVFGNSSGSVSSRESMESAKQTGNVRAEEVPTSKSAGHGPSIHIPEPSYDFGPIAQREKLTHTFVVQNKGEEPLKLIRAKGS